MKKVILTSKFIIGALSIILTSQSQAAFLTFEEVDQFNRPNPVSYYESQYGITFTGGGLLSEGANGPSSGSPGIGSGLEDYPDGHYLKMSSKTTGSDYSDSFFDIWITFNSDISNVSGNYIGNTAFGGSIFAYDEYGYELDTVFLSSLTNSNKSTVGSLGTFDFGDLNGIKSLHMISTSPSTSTGLDNFSFTPVPIPAAVWLFFSGLISLFLISNKSGKA